MQTLRHSPTRTMWAFFVPIFALGALWSTSAQAGPWSGNHHRWQDVAPEERAAHASERIIDVVAGTEQQREQLEDVFLDIGPRLRALRAEGKAIHEDMTAAFTAETVDAEEVEDVRTRFVSLVDDASSIFTEGIVSVGNILTVDQRIQLVEARKQMRRWHRR